MRAALTSVNSGGLKEAPANAQAYDRKARKALRALSLQLAGLAQA
jgi:hypothetical protein